jgi:RHS repeat-associated protein
VPGLFDTSGNVVPNSATTYWPYGAVRTGGIAPTTQTDKQFTGQRTEPGDSVLGLYNYNARFYSTFVGMFVSADSVTQGNNDAASLNRFAYVRDNPLRYTDPTGHCVGDLPCNPAVAMNIAACGADSAAPDDCLAVFLALGWDPYYYDSAGKHLTQEFLDAWHFAAAAVNTNQFWENYYDPRYNPRLHADEIRQGVYGYQTSVGTACFCYRSVGLGELYFDPVLTLLNYAENASNNHFGTRFDDLTQELASGIIQRLGSESCQQAIIGWIGLGAEASGNEEVAVAAGALAYGIDALHNDPQGAANDLTVDLLGSGDVQRAAERYGAGAGDLQGVSDFLSVYGVLDNTSACVGE